LITVDEIEDEEYWSDEKPVKQIQHKVISDELTKKKPAPGKKPSGQSSISSFFKK
jgi:hypothetical protein